MDTFALARRVSDAASFFDTARGALAERERAEASLHVERLHEAAQLLAGERTPDLYMPEDATFVTDEHYSTDVSCGAPLNLSHWRNDKGQVSLCISSSARPFMMYLHTTATECRSLSAALKQLADDAEASAEQYKLEPRPALSVVKEAA